jgi:hypothetical protein
MIDGLILEQVRNDPDIQGMLGTYEGRPAFFYQKAPSDMDSLWADGCFPRMDYSYDLRNDPGRKYSANMFVDIWCSDEGHIMPEDMEPKVIELLSGSVYTGEDNIPLLVQWKRTDSFETAKETKFFQKDKNMPTIIGSTLQFDVIAFPSQLSFDPDPIEGLNYWTKHFYPEACVLPMDARPGVMKPGKDAPVVYWQFISSSADDSRNTYAANWYQGQFIGHVIVDNEEERSRWVKAIVEELNIRGEVILADNSPLFIDHIVTRWDVDRVWDGQISVTGTFGVLATPRKNPVAPKLNHVFWG